MWVIKVTFGTVASAKANSSFAPCLIMPPCSCAVPGRNPGTSTNVTIGMLKQSQNRTKRAAFRELSMSRQPASPHRLVGNDADRRAFHPGEADQDVAREIRLDLEEIAVVNDLLDQLLHVVGLVRAARHERVERRLDSIGG